MADKALTTEIELVVENIKLESATQTQTIVEINQNVIQTILWKT